MTNTEIHIEHVEYCESLKKEYYTRCIKMLYNWLSIDEKHHYKACKCPRLV